jgi:hypothetical protein
MQVPAGYPLMAVRERLSERDRTVEEMSGTIRDGRVARIEARRPGLLPAQ